MIELTPEQVRALGSEAEPRMHNPETGETFALVCEDIYQLIRRIVESQNRCGWDDRSLDEYEHLRTYL